MPKAVRCVVEECVYNDGQHCGADSILIKSDGNEIVGTPRGTSCDTFAYRKQPVHSRRD